MPQTLRDIQVLKVELEGARLERRRQEEYEVRMLDGEGPEHRWSHVPLSVVQELRKQCMQHPSRSQTRAAIASVTEDIVALETEGQATAETVEVRHIAYDRGPRAERCYQSCPAGTQTTGGSLARVCGPAAGP